MRLVLLALSLATVSGCDALRDVEPYAGVIVVSLAPTVDEAALSLVAADDTGCNDPLRVRVDADGARLAVRVRGIERPRTTCLAIIPASALIALPFAEQGTFPIEVTHAGATDLYRYTCGVAGCGLEAIRTSTTRLGPD